MHGPLNVKFKKVNSPYVYLQITDLRHCIFLTDMSPHKA